MSTITMTAVEAHEKIREATGRACRKPKDCTGLKVGDVARQGDVYLTRVADDHQRGARLTNRQLAVGVSRGARHVAQEPAEVYEGTRIPSGHAPTAMLGPCVVVPAGRTAVVTHPEHAHFMLGEGVWQVTHQLDAFTRRRVED
jgi:hypothetical protein